MNRILITTLLVAAGSLTTFSEAFADHNRSIRRDFEIRRVELEHDYRARREANKYAYHRERDILRAEKARVARIDCHETRARRMRALNREMSSLTRRYNLTNREIAARYHSERDALRTSYEFALRSSRRAVVTTRPVVVERHVAPVLAHPADCSCNVCSPPVPVIETPTCRDTGLYDDGFGSSRYDRGYDRGYAPAGYSRGAGGMNWAGLLLNLIN